MARSRAPHRISTKCQKASSSLILATSFSVKSRNFADFRKCCGIRSRACVARGRAVFLAQLASLPAQERPGWTQTDPKPGVKDATRVDIRHPGTDTCAYKSFSRLRTNRAQGSSLIRNSGLRALWPGFVEHRGRLSHVFFSFLKRGSRRFILAFTHISVTPKMVFGSCAYLRPSIALVFSLRQSVP